ncbi:MAG TPA: phosphate ABC transporter permease subunit PstC [Rhodospirillaceae bacterium]|nr:phosphate ABC transporter permease subunit PstC [Rhodospirillaceae bacterium]MAX63570.1 phosphate ABC transporter permease subunit PstC [Rhodospirillaceae bacterium]MBB56358.1 phosphate ABC transporter permease subunit PstC [Rhodospirillaceae bacterium]HAE02069.1 phosphate ABC transporter permease subunit PstC [Rhodospirillaceae bacterium]HAJ20274.1 phosphate ABC transporter permease subunit PstC [Rhodospirillaceae bacterium]|tara:strand:- start:82495 stop:83874 length:1380 start_codon:yes stop_codon:yes gene_type:complete
MFGTTALAILVLAIVGFILARGFATSRAAVDGTKLNSLPSYYGTYVALWTGVPALLLILLWSALQEKVLNTIVMGTFPDEMLAGMGTGQLQLLLSEIRSIAGGRIFGEPAPEVLRAAEMLITMQNSADYAMIVVGCAAAVLGLVFTRSQLSNDFRARTRVESFVKVAMILCSIFAILVTVGIVFSLLFESYRFFQMVPWYEFFFGLSWEPQIPMRDDQVAGAGAFGAVPVFLGTIVVATIAMLFATPIGLLSAIYMAEYATPKFRDIVKPILEILAGIPTVVYGFFAVLTVAPALRQMGASIGMDVAANSALAAGGVMGIMIIPFISSLSDDALRAVPHSMREGSYGLGATKAETITAVLFPAALPGIVGGILLAVSRAIGETMIVVMAAGLIASLTVNPFSAVTTVTVQIVTLLIGDTEFDSPKTLAAFALGLVLFVATLCLNVLALRIVQKYREKYD